LDALISCSIAQAYSTQVLTCVHCTMYAKFWRRVQTALLACLLSFAGQLLTYITSGAMERHFSATGYIVGPRHYMWPTTLSRPCCSPAANCNWDLLDWHCSCTLVWYC